MPKGAIRPQPIPNIALSIKIVEKLFANAGAKPPIRYKIIPMIISVLYFTLFPAKAPATNDAGMTIKDGNVAIKNIVDIDTSGNAAAYTGQCRRNITSRHGD